MSNTIDFPGVQPGVISALLFIFLDIFTVGLLDIVLARVVCLVYYRSINEGRPISVKSADIPGLSNYLLGRWLSWINLFAIFVKLGLLAVVLTANISIGSKEALTEYEVRDATFTLEPSDAHISYGKNNDIVYTVRRRYESSKSCFKDGDGDERITYYALRFNLQNNQKLLYDNGTKDVNETASVDVDDASIICMSPDDVNDEDPLITVVGCTRLAEHNAKNDKRNNNTNSNSNNANDDSDGRDSCLTVVSQTQVKPAPGDDKYKTGDLYMGEIVHEYRDYNNETVRDTFPEYDDPLLTCLSTEIGIDSTAPPSRYTHCLLVAFKRAPSSSNSSKMEINETIVERWILGPDDAGVPERSFIMEYPGIRFDGHFDIGRLASARYLQLPFPFTDFRTLSGELVAQASHYQYLGGNASMRSRGRVGRKIYKDHAVVTTVYKFAVAMVAVSVILVLVAFVVTQLYLYKDRRPRFNTINGLSSIVREEHTPSGRSYDEGESAILGLRFTQDDRMHFGPLSNYEEGRPFQDGYDVS